MISLCESSFYYELNVGWILKSSKWLFTGLVVVPLLAQVAWASNFNGQVNPSNQPPVNNTIPTNAENSYSAAIKAGSESYDTDLSEEEYQELLAKLEVHDHLWNRLIDQMQTIDNDQTSSILEHEDQITRYLQQIEDVSSWLETFSENYPMINEALELKEKIAVSYEGLGTINFLILPNWTQAERFFLKSLTISKQLVVKKHAVALTPRTSGLLGQLYLFQNNLGKAEKYLLESISGYKELGIKEDMGDQYIWLSQVYYDLGKLDKANDYLQQGRDLKQQVNISQKVD